MIASCQVRGAKPHLAPVCSIISVLLTVKDHSVFHNMCQPYLFHSNYDSRRVAPYSRGTCTSG